MKPFYLFLFLLYWNVKYETDCLKSRLKTFWRRARARFSSLGMLVIVTPVNMDPLLKKLCFCAEIICGMLIAIGIFLLIGSVHWYFIKDHPLYSKQWFLLGIIALVYGIFMGLILQTI